MRRRRPKRRSFVQRKLRREFRAFLRAEWRLVALLAATVLGCSLWMHVVVDRPYLSGLFDGVFATVSVGLVLLGFLMRDGVFTVAGGWGESNTRDVIAKAVKRGQAWGAVHNIELDRQDVDHLLVTPAGVYALESKWRFGRLEGWQAARYAEQALRGSRKAASVMRSVDVGLPYDVTPVVVVWGRGQDELPDGGRPCDGVLVLGGGDLEGWLGRQATGRLAQDNAEQLLARLEAFVAARPVPLDA